MAKSRHHNLKKMYHGHLFENPDYPEWQDWEINLNRGDEWFRGRCPLNFKDEYEYRYNPLPKTIMVNGHEVPEPCKVMPELGTKYWFPVIGTIRVVSRYCFDNDKTDRRIFRNNMMHLDEEAARKHSIAMWGE